MEDIVVAHIKKQPLSTQTRLISYLKCSSSRSQGDLVNLIGNMTPSMVSKFNRERKHMYGSIIIHVRSILDHDVILDKLDVPK